MNRREMLGLLGNAVAVPMLAGWPLERLWALGRSVHDRARTRPLRVLDPHSNETVTRITDLIIPATDTPGARAAHVSAFIDLILAEWYEDDERDRFLDGLADIDDRSTAKHGTTFLELDERRQVAILSELDAELSALRDADENPQDHFFHRMKWLTLYGYYTSEIGVTQELEDPIIPGRYDPCVETGIPSPAQDG